MFDHPFADQMPGKLSLIGWPWHGMMTMPASATTAPPSIALPNGSNLLLRPISWENLSSPADFALPGDCLRFRDPRAGTLERTEAEQAADAAAGMTWRPDVLIAPVARVLYGQRFSAAQRVAWIVHGDERNWMVRLESGLAQLRLNALVFGRDRDTMEAVTVVMSRVGDYTAGQFPAGTYGYAVIDAIADGTRALVGTYLRRPLSVNDDPAWFAPCRIPLVELWELRLSHDGEVWTGEYECIRTPNQIIGSISNPPRPQWTTLSTSMGVEWEQTSSDPVEWTGKGVGPDGDPSQMVGSTPAYLDQEPGGWLYEESGRIAGAYYADTGAVVEIRVALTVVDAFSASLDSSMTSTPAVTLNNPMQDLADYELISEGSYQLTANYSSTSSSVTTLRLLVGGLEVSRAVISIQAGMASTYQASLDIVHDPNSPAALEERASSSSNSASRLETIEIDGTQVFSSSLSSTDPSAESVAVGGSYAGRAVRQNWISWAPATLLGDAAPELAERLFEIVPVRYSTQLLALAVRDMLPARADITTIGVAGSRTGAAPGASTRNGALNHLFGSHNPVTGQFVRDTANPVCWV